MEHLKVHAGIRDSNLAHADNAAVFLSETHANNRVLHTHTHTLGAATAPFELKLSWFVGFNRAAESAIISPAVSVTTENEPVEGGELIYLVGTKMSRF